MMNPRQPNLDRVEIQGSSSFEQGEEFLVIDDACVEVDLEGKQESEEEFVLLVETTVGVPPH